MKDGNCIVIDCGTGMYFGAIRKIKNPFKIIALYITHLHIDRVNDVVSFADSYDLSKQFKIYGPKGIKEIMEVFEKYNGQACLYTNSIIDLGHYYKLHSLPNGNNVSCFKIPHSIPCYGYFFFEDTNGIHLCYLSDTSGVDLSALGKIHILIHEATCGLKMVSQDDHCNATIAA
ncbi:Zinc phosphodiesterase [Entamoeba marina]